MPINADVIKKILKFEKLPFTKKELEELKGINDEIRDGTLLYHCLNLGVNSPENIAIVETLVKNGATLNSDDIVNLNNNVAWKVGRSNANPQNLVLGIDKFSLVLAKIPITQLYEAAIKSCSVYWIEYLIDNKYQQNPINIHNEDNRYWIRVFRDIDNEINNLLLRELSPNLLYGHDKINATKYSPATYVNHGYNPHLFNESGKTGVYIKPNPNRKIDYWYSGLIKEELTDNFNFNVKVLENYDLNRNDGHHFIGIKEEEIATIYPACVKEKHSIDKYGILARYMKIKWNEGLFRYRFNEIVGIYINEKNYESIKAAKTLRTSLCKKFRLKVDNLPYISYNSGELKRITSEEINTILANYQENTMTYLSITGKAKKIPISQKRQGDEYPKSGRSKSL